MQAFSRRGFQLRSASIETRSTYTGFLVLMLPGIATLIALSLGRVGFNAAALSTYYRGSEGEMSFPKTFWQLMEVSHFHLFTVPVVVLILSHLLYATPTSTRFRLALTSAAYSGALLDAGGPWAIRYVAGAMAYLLLLGWALLAGSMLMIVFVSLFSMWGPDAWVERLFAPSRPGEEGNR